MTPPMTTSEAGIGLIKSFESCRLVAYRDVVGVWTIGYGSTVDVAPGMQITQAQADERLKADLKDAERAVNDTVKVPLEQCEFDACVSLAFNIGGKAFKNSTLARLLNAGETEAAGLEFRRWDKAGGQVVAGLTRRRWAEQRLFEQAIA